MTWKQLLADLRNYLQDTASSPKWSDAQLALFTQDAIRDYSLYFPQRIDRVELELDEGSYELPEDFVDVIHVESPKDRYLEPRQDRPGIKLFSRARPFSYFIQGGNLYLMGSPFDSEEVLLTYFAVHPVPENEKDKEWELTLPLRDVELIRLYVKAQVHIQMRTKQARLDRFDPTSGRRDDNPLMPETNSIMDEYKQKISDRIPGRSIRLYRPGRMK